MSLSIKSNIIASSNRKVWPLTGGVHPEENKHQSTQSPITRAPLPRQLILPVSQHAGSPAEPVVNVGDQVLKGQIIARATGFVSLPVHAPTSGIVTAIEPRAIPHPSGMNDICIVIDTDGQDQWSELAPVTDYTKLKPAELVEKIRNAGISGMGGAGFPTAIKMTPATPVKTLILNGTECEPYITADDMLMRERAEDIIRGAEILMHLLKAEECLIGIEDNKPEAIQAMTAVLNKKVVSKNMEIVVFPTIYPSGGEKQLIQILTGQEVTSGRLPADSGIVVQNVGTAAAVYEAIILGRPLISRITTLTGEALDQPCNMDVLLGTSAVDILKAAGLKSGQLSTLVFGGPMMGFTVDQFDVPVIKTSNCLIAGTSEEFPRAPDAQACIRCGLCAEACPSSLLPQQLYWHAQAKNHEQLMHHNLFDCIECGACSYVCPSTIPLVQYYRASKGAIRSQEAKNAKAEHSKARYETRLARLEQDKLAREAKRKANAERAAKLKAAKAKAAAEKPAVDTPAKSAEITEDDPVKAAIARAKAKKAAAAAATTTTAEKPVLSTKQKELKIQLSMAKAQLKKAERALKAAELAEENTEHFTKQNAEQRQANIRMLTGQIDSLQAEFDAEASSKVVTPAAPIKEKKSKPVLSEDEKKQKIELAMAKASLRKAERALSEALEQNSEATEALKETVDDCRKKVEQLAAAAGTPNSVETKPEHTAKKARPVLSDEAKKLKIESAMANAAVKKLLRAIEKASGDELESLKKDLPEAEEKARQAKTALEQL